MHNVSISFSFVGTGFPEFWVCTEGMKDSSQIYLSLGRLQAMLCKLELLVLWLWFLLSSPLLLQAQFDFQPGANTVCFRLPTNTKQKNWLQDGIQKFSPKRTKMFWINILRQKVGSQVPWSAPSGAPALPHIIGARSKIILDAWTSALGSGFPY